MLQRLPHRTAICMRRRAQSIENRLVLSRNEPGAGHTSLTLSQNINNVFQRTTQTAGNLQHRQDLGWRAYLNTQFNYTGYTARIRRAPG